MMYSYDRMSAKKKVDQQEVHWVPPKSKAFRTVRQETPDRLWILYKETEENSRPSLPFRPVDRYNAFFESWADDWWYQRGTITLAGRQEPTGFWVLLEWYEK